ncbi:MAG: LCP family protein [Oscillospiraceae bacterium]|nr:LCP family protein [Oscillospiraceae bacterium]
MHNDDELKKEFDWQAFAPPPEALNFGENEQPEKTPAKEELPEPKPDVKQPKKRKRRRRSALRRVLLWLLIVVTALAGTVAVLAAVAATRMNIAPMQPTHAAIARRPNSSPLVTTILVLGVDDGHRADAVMLLSIDHRTATLRMTSIARDTLVRYPGGDFRRINEATIGRNGSGSLGARVVAENFGIRVDHYILLDYDAFADIIDALGGIAVPMTTREINYLTSRTWLRRHLNAADLHRQMEQNGVVWLTGPQAQMFARIRTLDNDFERGRRQRVVIDAMLQRVQRNPFLLIPLVINGLPGVYTSISHPRVVSLALSAPLLTVYRTAEHRIPAPGTSRNETRNRQFVIVPNYAENARLLREFVYGR